LACAIVVWAAPTAAAAESAEDIAAKYPGDRGIVKDERVLLHEDFEAGRIDRQTWTTVKNAEEALSFTSEVPPASSGTRSLLVTATLGKNTGGHLFRRFKPGAKRMHARYYVRFAEDCDRIHHFVRLGGDWPPVQWPTGGAGERPRGDDRFSTGIEPCASWKEFAPPGAWHFYTYWCRMKRHGDRRYWGNSFRPEPPVAPERGRWYCVEMSVTCNTVGKADGRQAVWIDGKKVGDFGGFEWRTAEPLDCNFFLLMLYVTDRWTKHAVTRVWFDDVVVATEYVGPIKPAVGR
jgi:hypothetical protein